MNQPEKPFCCNEIGCGESFTNADRLAVHAKKHDLQLQLGTKGGTFVADQTPTPTRFFKNCEDVGLFQDLQNVNLFEDSFKREMESRASMNSLSLENRLTTTTSASDDTLHTPHIFPHITNDSGLNLFDNKSHEQLNLTARNSTSNDAINQTLNKCLTSSAEDNLSPLTEDNRYYLIKNDEIKKSKRAQFVRQNSVDIVDNESSSILMKHVTNNDIVDEVIPVKQGLKSRRIKQSNNFKEIRIPMISISDSSKSDLLINIENKRSMDNNSSTLNKLLEKVENSSKNLALLSVPDTEKISLKTSVNNNFNKYISQKSIEMEIANFTREAAQKTHDMNNISIEDIEEINSENFIKDSSVSIVKSMNNLASNSTVIENQNSNIIKKFLGSNIVYSEKSKNSDTSDNDISKHTYILNEKNVIDNINSLESQINNTNSTTHVQRQSVIFQKNCNQTPSIKKNESNAYELAMKLPNGNIVYLKEVARDEVVAESTTSPIKSTPEVIPNSISILNNDVDNITSTSVKRKLYDVIQANKKNAAPNFKLPIKQINQTLNNSDILRECIILPQTLPVNKLISSHIITKTTPLLPVGLVSPSEPICSNLNLVDSTKLVDNSHPKVIVKKKSSINKDKIVGPNEKDKQKKACIQVRNRAAVNRYRTRKKQLTQLLEDKNHCLERENKNLTNKLTLAVQEIKRLNDIIALHSECSINIQSHKNVGVIKQTDLCSVDNSRNNQTMVIVQNKKLPVVNVIKIED